MRADPKQRKAYMQQYAQSEAGKAARMRARRNYIEKRRGAGPAPLRINPHPLAQVLANWRNA